jgi:radical SAM superfamily enzyme YgiQ (UPF0313 family)
MAMIDAKATPTMGILTTRGCPYTCVFCANSLDRHLRHLNPVKAVDQLEYLHKSFGVTGFDIFDDAFLAKTSHAVALCEEMLRRNLKVSWWAGARAVNLSADVLALMRRAGCRAISFGVETGTDEVLRASRKAVTCAQMLEAFATAAGAGFERIQSFLITGLPGETPDTIDRTVAFLKQLRGIAGPAWRCESLIGQLPLIYPGTELETIAVAEGTFPGDFSWNSQFIEPKRYLPLVNKRYWAVPHFQNRNFPLDQLCQHLKGRHWSQLSRGRRKRYRFAPLRKVACKLGLM